MDKLYIGDGVYATVEHGELVLTTENGISTTNRIVLGERECQVLVNFLARFGFSTESFT